MEKKSKKLPLIKRVIEQKYLLLMALPAIIWVFIFSYAPMYGLYMGFVDYKPGGPFFSSFFTSEFVGFKWFSYFFESGDFFRIMRNTLATSFLSLIISFPAPLILAIAINEVNNRYFKKTVQTVSYLPHFISWVIVANIFLTLLSAEGLVNNILQGLHLIDEPILFFQEGKNFWGIIASANTWKDMGFNSIIYLAAIAGINPNMYEAAKVDGANRFQQILYVTLPALKPTIVILLILALGGILNAGFDQQYLMQNDMVLEYSDVIDTYTYRYGLQNGMFSYGAAVGFFKSIVAFILVVTANRVAKKIGDNSLF
nr:ABC transporter permease subunit [Neobacillus niacini]